MQLTPHQTNDTIDELRHMYNQQAFEIAHLHGLLRDLVGDFPKNVQSNALEAAREELKEE